MSIKPIPWCSAWKNKGRSIRHMQVPKKIVLFLPRLSKIRMKGEKAVMEVRPRKEEHKT